MPFNIADFNASISRGSIAQTSHFEGWILGGPGSHSRSTIGGNILRNYGLEEGMRFRIESLNMPGRQLVTLDQNYHGPTRSIPYRFTNQPITMTIILSRDMREREVFMKWQDYLVGHYRTNMGRRSTPAPFDTKYYYDGVGTIQIRQYSYPVGDAYGDSAGSEYELQNYINLIEAYPINVNDIQMAWSDEGYAKLQVEIRYHHAVEFNKNFGDPSDFEREVQNKEITGIIRDTSGSNY